MTRILAILSLGVIFGSHAADACSYTIDQAAMKKELETVVAAGLKGVTKVSAVTTEFSYYESKPTPMCPEEMTYNAKVSVRYGTGATRCQEDFSIKKIESWSATGENVYTVSGSRLPRCFKENSP